MNAKLHSGKQIKAVRRHRGWFQSDLAAAVVALANADGEAFGRTERTLDPSLISHWESGRIAVPYHWRPYVAEALGMSMTALFGMLEEAA